SIYFTSAEAEIKSLQPELSGVMIHSTLRKQSLTHPSYAAKTSWAQGQSCHSRDNHDTQSIIIRFQKASTHTEQHHTTPEGFRHLFFVFFSRTFYTSPVDALPLSALCSLWCWVSVPGHSLALCCQCCSPAAHSCAHWG
uniref:Uncharacterized protein n=1 Tax=Zonotrichia albicollis TaxID=44394 RepID=A0A8D2MEA1_ZONAL